MCQGPASWWATHGIHANYRKCGFNNFGQVVSWSNSAPDLSCIFIVQHIYWTQFLCKSCFELTATLLLPDLQTSGNRNEFLQTEYFSFSLSFEKHLLLVIFPRRWDTNLTWSVPSWNTATLCLPKYYRKSLLCLVRWVSLKLWRKFGSQTSFEWWEV